MGSRVGFALAQATCNPVAYSLIPELFPSNRTAAMAVYNCAIYLGRAAAFGLVFLAGQQGLALAGVSERRAGALPTHTAARGAAALPVGVHARGVPAASRRSGGLLPGWLPPGCALSPLRACRAATLERPWGMPPRRGAPSSGGWPLPAWRWLPWLWPQWRSRERRAAAAATCRW